MKLYEALNINIEKRECICFVGAGGKTTAMFILARELSSIRKKVLATTTTNIYFPKSPEYDFAAVGDHENILSYAKAAEKPGIYIAGSCVAEDEKLKGLSVELIDQVFESCPMDFVLVEGDGSRKKSIKAPAAWEPVIPPSTTMTVGLIGLDSIGSKVDVESVHRPEEFCRVCDCKMGDTIKAETLSKLILHPEGLFKNSPASSRCFVLLNKADDWIRLDTAMTIKEVCASQSNITVLIAISDWG